MRFFVPFVLFVLSVAYSSRQNVEDYVSKKKGARVQFYRPRTGIHASSGARAPDPDASL